MQGVRAYFPCARSLCGQMHHVNNTGARLACPFATIYGWLHLEQGLRKQIEREAECWKEQLSWYVS